MLMSRRRTQTRCLSCPSRNFQMMLSAGSQPRGKLGLGEEQKMEQPGLGSRRCREQSGRNPLD